MMKMNSTTWLHAHRLPVIIAAALLVIITIGIGYTMWSSQVWDDYQTSYERWHHEASTKIDAAIKLPAESEAERSSKLVAFMDMSTSINRDKDTLCQPNSLVRWQQGMEQHAQRRQECSDVVRNVLAFDTAIQEVVAYLKDEEKIATIIAQAAKSSGATAEKKWQAQEAAWQKAYEEITNLSGSSPFQPVKAVAAAKTKAIKEAWAAVAVASKAKNEVKFVEAQQQLSKAYASLNDIGKKSVSEFKKVSASAQSMYIKL